MADTTSVAIARRRSTSGGGLQFDGDRDIYESAGYLRTPEFNHYYEKYRRGDIAARIIEAPAIESWGSPPEILDGEDEETGKDNTQFAKALKGVISGRFTVEDEFLGLWAALRQLDVEAGIGQYGCLLLGVKDGSESLIEPLVAGGASSPDDLLYATVYNEGNARILKTVSDPMSARFGQPEFYDLMTDTGQNVTVHWSRVIHFCEGGQVYGLPRLERVLNRLFDLDKVLAGGGEGAWRMLVPRYVAESRDDYEVDPTDTSTTAQIDEFIHDLRHWLDVEGVDVKEFAGSIADPSPAVRGYLSVIAGALGIPQRILIGSERGELASSMDEVSWAKRIEERRENVVNALIKRTLIRLVYAGILPKPSSGAIAVKWDSLLSLDDNELAELGERIAKTLTMLGLDVEPAAFVEAFIPRLDPKDVEKPEPEPMQPALAGVPPGNVPADTNAPEAPGNPPVANRAYP